MTADSAEPVESPEAERLPKVDASMYRRLTSGLPGYALAMAVCFAMAGALMLLTPNRTPNSVPTVNYGIDLARLREAAAYPVYAPVGLGRMWKPTSSRLTGTDGGPVAWHLGFATPRDEHAALEESDEDPDGDKGFVSRMTSQGTSDGSQRVAGSVWKRYFRADKHQRSLVRRLDGVTLVVTGTASYAELGVLAGALTVRPEPTPTPTRSPR